MTKMHNLFPSLLALLFLSLAACNNAPQNSADAGNNASATMDSPAPSYGGLALYTLRDAMADNPKQVLKKIAEIGYKNIEA
ncbi:MAG: hypothetical protein KDK39_01730, partial [Leptospiraceae bacterium]|nr:hypothetical protein [Leptospiraceae bacterium]